MSSFLSDTGLQRLWTNGWKTKYVPRTDQMSSPTLDGSYAFITETGTPEAVTVSMTVTRSSSTSVTLTVGLSKIMDRDLYIFFRCQGVPISAGGNRGRIVIMPAGIPMLSYTENTADYASINSGPFGYGVATLDTIFDAEILNEEYLSDKYTITLNKSFLTRGDKQFAFVAMTDPTYISNKNQIHASLTYRIISSDNQQGNVISGSNIIVVLPSNTTTRKKRYLKSANISSLTGSGTWKIYATTTGYTHEPTGTVLNKLYTRTVSLTLTQLDITSSYIDPTIPVNSCYMIFTSTTSAAKGKTVLFYRYYPLIID